jgi:hypothetical protein
VAAAAADSVSWRRLSSYFTLAKLRRLPMFLTLYLNYCQDIEQGGIIKLEIRTLAACIWYTCSKS